MKELLERIICSSLNNVFAGQPNLSDFVPQLTAEREPNISFHLANELWKFLFWLDCDFDVTKTSHADMRPDIIFHKRGTPKALNFLVVEVKRKSNPMGFEGDINKIRNEWFGGDLLYQFGASVVIDENAGDYELRLIERGSGEAVQPRKKADLKLPITIADLILNARKMLNVKADKIVKADKLGQDTAPLVQDLNEWVCRAYSRPWNIDDIIVGVCAGKWLKRNNLLPSSWGLNNDQVQRIRDANIRLTIMYSPASVLTLQPNPIKDSDKTRFVIIDANVFEDSRLTRDENIATILHEIGHVLWEVTRKTVSVSDTSQYLSNADCENAADDFAGKVGYGGHIASGLRKLAEIMPRKFDNENVKTRIKRMEEQYPNHD